MRNLASLLVAIMLLLILGVACSEPEPARSRERPERSERTGGTPAMAVRSGLAQGGDGREPAREQSAPLAVATATPVAEPSPAALGSTTAALVNPTLEPSGPVSGGSTIASPADPTAEAAPEPSAEPANEPALDPDPYREHRQEILNSMNLARLASQPGIVPLTLGTNEGPQSHAVHRMEYCYFAYWADQGRKIHELYQFFGGDQYSESWVWQGECLRRDDDDWTPPDKDYLQELRELSWDEPEHPYVFDPNMTVVSIGYAQHETTARGAFGDYWVNPSGHAVTATFNSDYVEWTREPKYNSAGILRASGRFKNGAFFDPDQGYALFALEQAYHGRGGRDQWAWTEKLRILNDDGSVYQDNCEYVDRRVAEIVPPFPEGQSYFGPDGQPYRVMAGEAYRDGVGDEDTQASRFPHPEWSGDRWKPCADPNVANYTEAADLQDAVEAMEGTFRWPGSGSNFGWVPRSYVRYWESAGRLNFSLDSPPKWMRYVVAEHLEISEDGSEFNLAVDLRALREDIAFRDMSKNRYSRGGSPVFNIVITATTPYDDAYPVAKYWFSGR